MQNQYIPTVKSSEQSDAGAFFFLSWRTALIHLKTKEHDFPQRVIYMLPENNTLHAWIEGDVNGQVKKSIYNYIRVQ